MSLLNLTTVATGHLNCREKTELISRIKGNVMSEYLREKRCGARTKATGQPCKRRDIYANGRCKLHGGLSTGARTPEGKKKSALNGFKKGWNKKNT